MALNTNQALCLFYMLTLYFFTATLSPNFPTLDNGTLIPIFRFSYFQNNYIHQVSRQFKFFFKAGFSEAGKDFADSDV